MKYLSHSSVVSGVELKSGQFDLRQGNGHLISSLFTDELSLRDILLQILPDFTPDDLTKSAVVLLDPHMFSEPEVESAARVSACKD